MKKLLIISCLCILFCLCSCSRLDSKPRTTEITITKIAIQETWGLNNYRVFGKTKEGFLVSKVFSSAPGYEIDHSYTINLNYDWYAE